MAHVECCLSNASAEGLRALEASSHESRSTLCLDRCGDCHRRPFLIVDGTLRTGDSYREILAALDEPQRVADE